jgi:MoaA/NifB/PqqE/SkfB family radical SAM enzyme
MRSQAPLPGGISVDLTSRCNLRCRHCYLRHQVPRPELSNEQMLARIIALKKQYPSAFHGGWLGGEPLLRKELLAAGTRLFPLNMVVTNGTLPLPDLPNTVFNISVDGTKKLHEEIRGPGIYDKIKAHADRPELRVNINCVLNRINAGCIEALVDEWRKTSIRGISFGFYSPARGSADALYLNAAEKDRTIDRLLALKRFYGDFILNSPLILRMMKSGRSQKVTSRCLAPRLIISIDSAGNVKSPCVMGATTDCSKCGCFVPFAIEAVFRKFNFASLRTSKLFYS